MTETEKIDLRLRIHELEQERDALRVYAPQPLDPSMPTYAALVQRLADAEQEAEALRAINDNCNEVNDRWEQQNAELRADLLTIARAVGCVHHAEGHAEQPGTATEIVAAVDALRAEVERLTFARDTISDERDVQRDVSKELRAEVERLRAGEDDRFDREDFQNE